MVIARPFYLGRYPVTRGEFAIFAKATGFDDARWQWPGFPQTDQHPVVNISHADAEAFAAWLSRETGKAYRLPSEAQWEYAARAGTVTARYWGEEWDSEGKIAHADGKTGTAPVGLLQANNFGVHDLLGNVWEWVADAWHDNYANASNDGSVWTVDGDPTWRVLRGSCGSKPRSVRAGVRVRYLTGSPGIDVGFRLSRTL